MPSRRLLLISGSLRGASVNTAVVETARDLVPPGWSAELYRNLDRLPHFNPDDDVEPLHPAVADLRAALGAADAIVICTPEYAGALPGSLKNLLDWSIGGGEMDGKAVAWINASTSMTGASGAHESLNTVLRYASTRVVAGACAHIPVARRDVSPDGRITDPAIRAALTTAIEAVTHAVEDPSTT